MSLDDDLPGLRIIREFGMTAEQATETVIANTAPLGVSADQLIGFATALQSQRWTPSR